jgi:hypothetical protein
MSLHKRVMKFTSRTALWIVCIATPLAWNQYARGYNIPSREPPAAEVDAQPAMAAAADAPAGAAGDTDLPSAPSDAAQGSGNAAATAVEGGGDATAPVTESGSTSIAPVVGGDNTAVNSTPESHSAPPATATEPLLDQGTSAAAPVAAQPETGGGLLGTEEALKLPAAPGETASADSAPGRSLRGEIPAADAVLLSPAEDRITIIVSEPRAEEAPSASALSVASESIYEVAPAALQPTLPKAKRAARKIKRGLVALLEPEQQPAISVRGLSKHETPIQAGERHSVQPLIGGRGVAARADLGRASPMSGAAPDVFATGHHVASAANCDAYADNPYFREDAFGRTLRVACQ